MLDESAFAAQRLVVEQDVLGHNDALARKNRALLAGRRIVALNLMSSPGSGKTTLLERTIAALGGSGGGGEDALGEFTFCVIEGDQQTANDALRIKRTGVPVVQVNTGDGCHLDASMVARAIDALDPAEGTLLMIENVGNLVCPAMFDLGETARVVIISVTEGEDKPLKYPNAFASADLCVITKTDLLPYLDLDVDVLRENVRAVNPGIEIVETSTKSDNDAWHAWLRGACERALAR